MSSKNWAKKPGYHRKTKILGRHQPNRRCLHTESIGGHEVYLHATKGWRAITEPEIANTRAGELYASFIQ